MSNLNNLHRLQVVDCFSDTQLQLGENSNLAVKLVKLAIVAVKGIILLAPLAGLSVNVARKKKRMNQYGVYVGPASLTLYPVPELRGFVKLKK